jgi:hypothetical protein
MFKIKLTAKTKDSKTKYSSFPKNAKNYHTYPYASSYLALNVPPGTILEVLDTSISNENDIIIRTYSDKRPFITVCKLSNVTLQYNLQNVDLWGDSLGGYDFKILDSNFSHLSFSNHVGYSLPVDFDLKNITY